MPVKAHTAIMLVVPATTIPIVPLMSYLVMLSMMFTVFATTAFLFSVH